MGLHMKTAIFTGLAFSVLVVPGFAADVQFLPHRDMAFPSPAALWTWSGFYIGANAGWSQSSAIGIENSGTGVFGSPLAAGQIPASVSLNQGGFIGGGQFGYNWQMSPGSPSWVLGFEGDFDGIAEGGNNTTVIFPGSKGAPAFSVAFERQLETVSSLRGRFGYVMVPDQLWYVTGGVAFGQTRDGSVFSCPGCAPPSGTESGTAIEKSTLSTGWTVGGGLEWKFYPAWSLKAEYLYADLGNPSNTLAYTSSAGITSTLTSTFHERDNIVRLGINYKIW
jgi:outer membrane immunogenic protein